MTATDKAREALREIYRLASGYYLIGTWADIRRLSESALSALADEGEQEEVWTVKPHGHGSGLYELWSGDGLIACSMTKSEVHRIAAVPRLERIERAAREYFRDLDEHGHADPDPTRRALNEEPKE